MLVLSRRCGESIQIGDGIAVTVLEVRGDKVRLGITAPDDVPVHRHELVVDLLAAGGMPVSGAGRRRNDEGAT